MNRKYTPISKCRSFWLWLFCSWNFPARMNEMGGYHRIKGNRIFGWEKEEEIGA